MLKNERQKKILDLIQEHIYLTSASIAKTLQVSEMTIRRDITEMANENKLTKLHGGAQKLDMTHKELTTDEKFPSHAEQKKYIGKVINSLVEDNATIFVGAGTTIYYVLTELRKENLFVITNSLTAFNYLIENTSYRIILIGGEFYPTTEQFIGDIATKALDTLNIDIAFASTNGILDNNITTSHLSEGAVQNAAFAHSKISCIVADSSKLNVSDVYTLCPLDQMDFLITDDEISDEMFAHYGQYTTILNEIKE
ncbi:MAG: DeoR/GlpR family DNA-binding transcription regulator [Streptococcaceae bacterium]|jgi:DeoR family lactose phosphotransferase system repressor|nr:DeoR/GlpR family DNA-binding transcription regulator [Streptococcaceae bacterium]